MFRSSSTLLLRAARAAAGSAGATTRGMASAAGEPQGLRKVRAPSRAAGVVECVQDVP
jgi:hypothetical protein